MEPKSLSPFDPDVLALFDAMPEAVWLSHPDGRVAFVSSKTLQLLDLPKEQVLENAWQDLIYPDDRAAVLESVANTLRTGEPYSMEFRIRNERGVYRWVRGRARAMRQGSRIVAFVGHIIDIDSYRVAELHAKAAEARFAQERTFNDLLFDTLPIMFWVADPDGRIRHFNRWFYEYTGIDADGYSLDDASEPIHPADRGGGSEVRYRRGSDGAYRWHQVHSEPIRDENGDVTGWFGYSIDVHDRRRASERQDFLLQATGALASVLDVDRVFQMLVAQCVPAMGDSAELFLLRDGKPVLAEIAAITAERAALVRRYAQLMSPEVAARLREMIRKREPQLVKNMGDEGMSPLATTPETRAIFKKLATRSLVVTPIATADEEIGALITGYGPSGRRYDTADVATFQLLAQRVAAIYENALRYTREHRVAETLQKASLPQSLPKPQSLRLHAFYAAGASEAHIGGDWYDAVELADGRVVLSVGDVGGRGLAAAVTMGSMRHIIRGIAHLHPDPALMLDAADRALRSENADTYVTAFVCVIDPIENTVAYASAGHPPALLRTSGATIVRLDSEGLPLGLRGTGEDGTKVVSAGEGDVLVLYTDGLTEAGRRPVEGEKALAAEVARGEVFAHENPARMLYQRLIGSEARDDIAILVAEIGPTPQVETPALQRWVVNALDEERMHAVRTEVLTGVATHSNDPESLFAAEMVLGELIGNVVRHTCGSVEIVLERRHGATVLHVLDEGEGFQFLPKLPTDAYSERGRGLYLTAQFARDFSVTRRAQGGSHARATL